MSRAILVFDLPTEADEFETAAHAQRWRSLVWEFSQWLRSEIKHGDRSSAAKSALGDARDELFALANANDVEIEP